MNACRCTHSILIRAAKTPKKTAIKLCHKQNQLFKQIKPPAVLQETLGSCWGGHSTQGAQGMAPSPAHCGHRAGTPPFSRKVDIFWKHPCYFTRLALFCTCAVALELFRKCYSGFCPFSMQAGWEGGAARGLALLSTVRVQLVQDLLQKTDWSDTQISGIIRAVLQNPLPFQREMYLRGRTRMEDLTK